MSSRKQLPRHSFNYDRIELNTGDAVFKSTFGSWYLNCPMPKIRKLQQLRQQFQELADSLDVCRSPHLRRELLKRMKNIISETDKLMSIEELHSDSEKERTEPPQTP